MPILVQITDKPSPGGGIRRVVDQHRLMFTARGWQVRELRLVRSGSAPQDVATAPIEVGLHLRSSSDSVPALLDAARGADIVHLHLGFASLSAAFVAAAASAAPLVVHLHDVSPFEGLGLEEIGVDGRTDAPSLVTRLIRWRRAPVRRAVWRRICLDARMIIAPSHYLARLAIAAGAPEACVVVVPHAVDALPINPLRPSACSPIIVYAGLLSEEKGAPLLLDAFGRLATPDAELVYVGDGPARVAMEQRAQGSRVRFLGHVDAAAVAMSMSNARVLAHPSLIPEGFGLVGIEAMQLGRPVVGFGLGGSADWLIVGKTGLVAARRDAASLAAALDNVLTDGILADRLGAAGRLLASEMYSAELVADELMTAMQSAMRVPLGRL